MPKETKQHPGIKPGHVGELIQEYIDEEDLTLESATFRRAASSGKFTVTVTYEEE